MAMTNFLTSSPGPGGTTAFAPTSMYQGGDYRPEIQKAAGEYAGNLADFATQYMGQKGALDSSFMENALSDAYSKGQQKAVGEWQNQQNLFSQWAMAQNQLAAQTPPEQEDPSFAQGALGGALTGISAGAAGGAPGMVAGGLIGGLGGGLAASEGGLSSIL